MNNVVITGRMKYKDSKEKFTSFQLSTRDGFGDNKQWNNHSCTCFGHTKKFIDNHTNDDDIISVNGYISYNKKEEGMTYTNIIVNNVVIEFSNKDSEDSEEPPF